MVGDFMVVLAVLVMTLFSVLYAMDWIDRNW
jgi:hypothetical protein